MSPEPTIAFDRHQADAYTDHLAALNESNPVLASEDIYNQFGVLLITKGTPLSPGKVKVLNQHRLEKTIEQQVEISRTLSDRELYDLAIAYLEERTDYLEIHNENDYGSAFAQFFLHTPLPPVIRQKLTVMRERLPSEFIHLLFSAWGCGLIAKEMKLSQAKQYNAFLCGLCHDLGILHLQPELLDFSTGVTPEKLRTMQSHVVIGKLIVEELGLWEPEIAQGILEHHERLDQSGYPTRKPADKMGIMGQIVAGADLIHHLSTTALEGKEAALKSCLPHFKIHYEAFKPEVCSAVFHILSRTKRHPQAGGETSAQLLQRIQGTQQVLQSLAAALPELLAQEADFIDQPGGTGIKKVSRAILDALRRSGLGEEVLALWLQESSSSPDPDPELLQELEEADAMQYELLWLFKRLGWCIELLQQQGQALPELASLLALKQSIDTSLKERWVHYH
ncbi:HD-GYP domain-containing protein [Aestuariirhabdus sp. LZHN29]|uniref:HD-GYP domain-containing protein n=1 Tax=Aestuariirhabdus sp. LZHN29 TaxID=3417462 RepID=UPI003CF35C77